MSLLQLSTGPMDAGWSFAHMANHRDINRLIFKTKSKRVDEFPLDPFDGSDNWLLNHQQMHNEMNEALGIPGQNLLQVDWNDPDVVQDWLFTNFTEHQQACQKLNIG